MSKRIDRERAIATGKVMRSGQLVDSKDLKEQRIEAVYQQRAAMDRHLKTLTILGGRLFGRRTRRSPGDDLRRVPD